MTEKPNRLFCKEINIKYRGSRVQGIAVGGDKKKMEEFVRLLEEATSLQETVLLLANTLDQVCEVSEMSRMEISRYALRQIERVRAGVPQ